MKYASLTRPEDFRLVYTQGKVRFGKYLAFHLLPVQDDQLKIGLSVSKKVGKAVTRNSVKRKLREIMNKYVSIIPNGYHIVIGAKAVSKTATFLELQEDVYKLLKESGLLT